MIGTEYVIEQLGQALKASHEVLAAQSKRLAELEAERDELLHRADRAPDAP